MEARVAAFSRFKNFIQDFLSREPLLQLRASLNFGIFTVSGHFHESFTDVRIPVIMTAAAYMRRNRTAFCWRFLQIILWASFCGMPISLYVSSSLSVFFNFRLKNMISSMPTGAFEKRPVAIPALTGLHHFPALCPAASSQIRLQDINNTNVNAESLRTNVHT